MNEEDRGIDQHVTDIERVAAEAEHTLGDQILGVHLFVQAAALDIGVSDHRCAKQQAQTGNQPATYPALPMQMKLTET